MEGAIIGAGERSQREGEISGVRWTAAFAVEGAQARGVAGGKELSEVEGSDHRWRGTIPVGVIIACGRGLSNYRYRRAVTGGQEHRWRGATAGGMERLQEERSDHMWRETITGWEEISQVNCSDRRYGGT